MRSNQKPKVFVVDDEPIIIASLEMALGAQYEVIAASTGSEAIPLARAHQCSVVLCDASLPQQGCRNVIAALRENPDNWWIPVIVMSGYLLGAEDLGAFAFIQKPFTRKEILSLVRNATQERPAPARALILPATARKKSADTPDGARPTEFCNGG